MAKEAKKLQDWTYRLIPMEPKTLKQIQFLVQTLPGTKNFKNFNSILEIDPEIEEMPDLKGNPHKTF